MKIPSRRMPEAPKRKLDWRGKGLAGLLAVGLSYFVYCNPWTMLVALILGPVIWVKSISHKRAMSGLAKLRKNESICGFALAFDRQTDTWIIRATYEEISRFLAIDGHPFPLRANDEWKGELFIDHEDLDDLAKKIAFRAGRSLSNTQTNPYYGKIRTLRDVVYFFQNQPRSLPAGT